MKQLEIDEEFIEETIDATIKVVEYLNGEIKELRDKNNDIFDRYITFCRLTCVLNGLKHLHYQFRNSFRTGFDLNDTVFNTNKCKEAGWKDNDVSGNPFFKQEETKDNDLSELEKRLSAAMEGMKESLKDHLNKEKEQEDKSAPLH